MKIDFDWLDSCTESELNSIIDKATHLLIEKDKETAKAWIEVIRDYCICIAKLHTDIPTLGAYRNWEDLAYAFDTLLATIK